MSDYPFTNTLSRAEAIFADAYTRAREQAEFDERFCASVSADYIVIDDVLGASMSDYMLRALRGRGRDAQLHRETARRLLSAAFAARRAAWDHKEALA